MPLEDDDAAVRVQTMFDLGEHVAALDDVLIHLNHGCVELSAAQHDRGPKLVSMLLFTRAWNALWRARVDAAAGYYVQAFTLCRAAYEDWDVLEYIAERPGEA